MTDQKLVDELEKAFTDEAYDGGMGAMSPEEFRDLVRTLAVTAGKVVDETRAPSSNEKLIEEAAKAIWSATDALTWEQTSEDMRESCRVEARAALAVFEKAHTPTGDEREALEAALFYVDLTGAKVFRWADPRVVLGDDSFASEMIPAILAAGFRRSEVPEPSAEEWAVRVHAAREKAIAKGYTPEHDAKHGVRHLLRWSIDYARRGRAEDSAGLAAAAIDLANIAYAELERLRHVADTMRAVSEALRTRYASDSQAAYFMREIDAALEALPEPQGEPSDAQVRAAAESLAHSAGYIPEPMIRAALRAAFAVTEQGENRDA